MALSFPHVPYEDMNDSIPSSSPMKNAATTALDKGGSNNNNNNKKKKNIAYHININQYNIYIVIVIIYPGSSHYL